jgi:RimJ/RimL family protein N-acetyltransferase
VAPPTLETKRLLLRPLTFDDFDDLVALHAEESFWRYPFGRGDASSFSFGRATVHPVLGVELHVLRLRRSEWRTRASE